MRTLFTRLALVAGLLAATIPAQSQSNYPPEMPGARAEVYKTILGDLELQVWIFNPPGHAPSDSRPAIVFFFGGGWVAGTPEHFREQARYFASRGMVAIAADYRVGNRHGVQAVSCVEDGKSAIRWVRTNAARLGIDPNRIAAAGGSAGGHVAAATATIPEFDAAGEDLSVSSAPNALVLFNPLTLLGEVEGSEVWDPDDLAVFQERLGVEPERLSPYHHVRPGIAPAIIFHGMADSTVPYASAEMFCARMNEAGNRCELVGYEGADHGFFNRGRGDDSFYYDTLRRADEFLESLGWLDGPPTIEEPGVGSPAG